MKNLFEDFENPFKDIVGDFESSDGQNRYFQTDEDIEFLYDRTLVEG